MVDVASFSGLDLRENRPVLCALCKQSSLKTVYSGTGHKGSWLSVKICKNDGLVFLSPRKTKKAYTHYYENEYAQLYHNLEVTDAQEKYKNVRGFLPVIRKHLKIEPKKILEVGAGAGYSLEYIKNEYPEAHCFAIEQAVSCQKRMAAVSIELLSEDLDGEWTVDEHGFDCIILSHVLEHTLDPIDVLKKVRRNLSSRGIAYIAVPNMMMPFGNLKKYWFRLPHTYYFSRETLIACANQAGLEVAEVHAGYELWAVLKVGKIRPNIFSNNFGRQYRLIQKILLKQKFDYVKNQISRVSKKLMRILNFKGLNF